MSMEFLSVESIPMVMAQAVTLSDDLVKALTISVAGIAIVFSALLLITLFIASLPRILVLVNHVWPELDDGHSKEGHPESQMADDTDVLAAIGFVLHTEFQRQLSAESLRSSPSLSSSSSPSKK